MSDFHIPLNYSNLQDFVSKKESILYSTFYKVISDKEDPLSEGVFPDVWNSHVLFTNKGIYFPEYQKKGKPKVKYIDWRCIGEIKSNKLKTLKFYKTKHVFKPIREPNFETIRSFKARKRKIVIDLPNIMKKRKVFSKSEIENQKISFELIKQRNKEEGTSFLQNIDIEKSDLPLFKDKDKDDVSEFLKILSNIQTRIDLNEYLLNNIYYVNKISDPNAYYEDIRTNVIKSQSGKDKLLLDTISFCVAFMIIGLIGTYVHIAIPTIFTVELFLISVPLMTLLLTIGFRLIKKRYQFKISID